MCAQVYLFCIRATPAADAANKSQSTTKDSPASILKIEDFLPERKRRTLSSGVNMLNNSREASQPGCYINQINPGQYTIDRTSLVYIKETNGSSAYVISNVKRTVGKY